MAIFGNFKGTTTSEFKIGKSGGSKISTGTQPSSDLSAGDLWIDSDNSTLKIYNSSWKPVGENLSTLLVDNGTLSVDSANDTVSIGSTSSNERLFVNGNLRLGTNPSLQYSGAYLDLKHSNGSGSVIRVVDNSSGTDPVFKVYNASNSAEVFKVDGSTIRLNDAYNMPTADGTAGQFLQTDGSGGISFSSSFTDLNITGTATYNTIEFQNSNIMKFNQRYTGASTGNYFTNGEYQKVVTIIPDGNSQNYQVVGRITAQNAGETHTVYFNAALRSGDPLPDLSWSIFYDEEYNGSRYIDPQLWTKETTTSGFIFAFKTLSTIYGTVTVDMEVIPRSSSQKDNVTVNTVVNSEQSSIDTGYTANDMTKVFSKKGQEFTIANAYTLPTADGTAGQVIKTDGSGTLSFTDAGGVGGSTTQVQYNKSGVLSGDADFTFDDSTNTLQVTNLDVMGSFSHVEDYGSITQAANIVVDYGVVTADDRQPTSHDSYTVAEAGALTYVNPGDMIFVSDETGGATMAFYDGTDWRRIQDRAVISS